MCRLAPWVALAAVLVAAACHRSATLDVAVLDHGATIPDVTLTVRSSDGAILASGQTRAVDPLRLEDLPPGPAVVEALVLTDLRAGYAARRITLRPGRNATTFELGRDLILTPLVRAEDPPPHPPSGPQLRELEADRRVAAVLELDWVEGTRIPRLAVETRKGTVRVEDVLADVGLEVTTVWSEAIPPGELGPGWPGESLLAEVLARHRNTAVPDGAWHLHLLLVPQGEPDLELALVVDPATRAGAVVFLSPETSDATALHAVLHEIGHLLNLPHPWEVGADTPSAMSYPWRWPGWNWNDPSAFRFDPAARHHLLRAADHCVRPGASPFGACWQSPTPVE